MASPGAKVIKAFNTTLAGTLMAGQVEDQSLDVFIAGDNAEAKVGWQKLFSLTGRKCIATKATQVIRYNQVRILTD